MNATKKLVIAMILLAGVGYAYANPPGWLRRNEGNQQDREAQEVRREEVRSYSSNRTYSSRSTTRTYGKHNDEISSPPPNNDPYTRNDAYARRNGRMSAEERRALRRQIGELNQSIYN